MIYGFSLLFFLLALVLGIPSLRHILRMRRINRHAASANGYVATVGNSLGWLWTSNFGNVTHPLIQYETPRGTPMALEVTTSSMFTMRRYEAGMRIEVIYSSTSPGEAYAKPEWGSNLRDLWVGVGALLLSAILYIVGRILVLPY